MTRERVFSEIKSAQDTGLFETLANSLPALVWVADASGACIWFNRQWLDFTGRTLEQELGDGWVDSVHPDDRQHCVETYHRNLSARQPSQIEYRLRHHSGDYRWILDRGGPRFDAGGVFIGFTGACMDIEDRKQAEAERSRFFDVATDILMTFKVDGYVSSVNPACERILGWTADEILKIPLSELVHPDDVERTRATGPHVLGGGELINFENRYRHKDGSYRWLTWRARPDPEGKLIYGAAVDITDRKAAETQLRMLNETLEVKVAERTRELAAGEAATRAAKEELRRHRDNLQELIIEQTRDLIAARDQAEAANRAKSEFLANMSHEIRTPMNAVIGLSHLLAHSEPLTARQREFIDTLGKSAESLLELINDLLDVSRLEAGAVTLETIPFTLCPLVQDVVRMMEGACKDKGLSFAVEGGLTDHRPFLGDPGKLKQILVNLCSNAVKFTESGGVRIIVSDARAGDGRDTVTLAVADTGIGIPQAKLNTIFDKFSQADSSISRKYGGTGLGLAISRSLTELMGGELTVESREGEGSIFTVRLTLEKCDAATPEARQIPVIDAAATRHRVLLVEDRPANVLVATSLLEALGYDCDVAGTGIEALERLAERQDYAVVLMDVQMPGMDGLEATRRVRAMAGAASRIAIIGMTAHALAGDRERCLDAGMDDYIPKPFAPAMLEAKLSDVIQRVRGTSARQPA